MHGLLREPEAEGGHAHLGLGSAPGCGTQLFWLPTCCQTEPGRLRLVASGPGVGDCRSQDMTDSCGASIVTGALGARGGTWKTWVLGVAWVTWPVHNGRTETATATCGEEPVHGLSC